MEREWKIETACSKEIIMNYLHFGTAGKRPFVILPGLSITSVLLSAEAIVQGYDIFADDFDCYLFDRRANLPDIYSIHDMACDTAEIMICLGLEKVDLLGISQGGMIAQVIAIEHPQMVNKLVLGSTASRIVRNSENSISEWIDLAGKGSRVELMNSFAERVYSPCFLSMFRDQLSALASSINDEDMARFRVIACGTDGFDVYDRLNEISCPILVLAAGEDRVTGRRASEEIAEKTGCRIHVFEGYGHAVYDESPLYRPIIREFLLEQ